MNNTNTSVYNLTAIPAVGEGAKEKGIVHIKWFQKGFSFQAFLYLISNIILHNNESNRKYYKHIWKIVNNSD